MVGTSHTVVVNAICTRCTSFMYMYTITLADLLHLPTIPHMVCV